MSKVCEEHFNVGEKLEQLGATGHLQHELLDLKVEDHPQVRICLVRCFTLDNSSNVGRSCLSLCILQGIVPLLVLKPAKTTPSTKHAVVLFLHGTESCKEGMLPHLTEYAQQVSMFA